MLTNIVCRALVSAQATGKHSVGLYIDQQKQDFVTTGHLEGELSSVELTWQHATWSLCQKPWFTWNNLITLKFS